MVEALSRAEGQLVPVATIPIPPEGISDAYSPRLAALDYISELRRLYNLPSAASFVWHEAMEAY